MFKILFSPSQDSALTNLGLLVLRLWLGSAIFFNHGIEKLTHFKDHASSFPDPLGIGQPVSLALVMFAEVAGSVLLVMGLLARFAALMLVIDLVVAFLMVHQSEVNRELAFVYLSGFVLLLITGGGMISLDVVLFGKSKKS